MQGFTPAHEEAQREVRQWMEVTRGRHHLIEKEKLHAMPACNQRKSESGSQSTTSHPVLVSPLLSNFRLSACLILRAALPPQKGINPVNVPTRCFHSLLVRRPCC